jgi:hypothetical protein
LNASAALELVDAMKPYLEWQSTSAFLKDPPPGYFYPPLDIFGKLASIKANLEANVYVNEYTFQAGKSEALKSNLLDDLSANCPRVSSHAASDNVSAFNF